jgi:hypothetical protein
MTDHHQKADSSNTASDIAMSDDELEQQVFDILKKEGDVTQEQAEEFLAVLFDIMQMMLDAGMDLESIQKFLDANQIQYDLED